MYYFFDTTEMAGVKRKVEATLESAAPLERSDGRDPDTRTSDKLPFVVGESLLN